MCCLGVCLGDTKPPHEAAVDRQLLCAFCWMNLWFPASALVRQKQEVVSFLLQFFHLTLAGNPCPRGNHVSLWVLIG